MTKQEAFEIITDVFQYVEYENYSIDQFWNFIEEDEEKPYEAYDKISSEFWSIVREAFMNEV